MSDSGDGKCEVIGRTMLEVTPDDQAQFDAVKATLGRGGRVGAFNRVVLVRVMLEACADADPALLVAAFDRWNERRFSRKSA